MSCSAAWPTRCSQWAIWMPWLILLLESKVCLLLRIVLVCGGTFRIVLNSSSFVMVILAFSSSVGVLLCLILWLVCLFFRGDSFPFPFRPGDQMGNLGAFIKLKNSGGPLEVNPCPFQAVPHPAVSRGGIK